MVHLVDNLHNLTGDNNQLVKGLPSLKYEFIDIKKIKTNLGKENYTLKQ